MTPMFVVQMLYLLPAVAYVGGWQPMAIPMGKNGERRPAMGVQISLGVLPFAIRSDNVASVTSLVVGDAGVRCDRLSVTVDVDAGASHKRVRRAA